VGVALLIALGCSAPFTRASAAPTSAHIYLYDNIFGITDVTNTYDGASVVSLTGDVVYVAFLTVSANGSTRLRNQRRTAYNGFRHQRRTAYHGHHR